MLGYRSQDANGGPMRQNLLTAAFATTLMVLVSFATPAQQAGEGEAKRWAQGMQGRLMMADRVSRWWNNAHIAEQVGVSDQQKAGLEAAADQAQEQRRAVSREFAGIYGQLVDALSAPQVDQSVIEKHRQEIADASASIMAVSVDQLFAVRQILTPDQWTTLRQIHPAALTLGQSSLRRVGAGPRSAGAQPQPN
jgi:Spy/CpxP family protein refolding chaperone